MEAITGERVPCHAFSRRFYGIPGSWKEAYSISTLQAAIYARVSSEPQAKANTIKLLLKEA
jgi:hypothetical protein